jgi:hypothetical protein
MQAQTIDHMFRFMFTKSAEDIVAHAKKKALAIQAKIEERQERLARLRKEYDIDDAALVQLLQLARKQAGQHQFQYMKSNVSASGNSATMEERTIGAGVVNNLLTEHDFLEAEKDQVHDLDIIVRNLKPIPRYATDSGVELPPAEFQLSKEELEYLGF